MRDLRELDDHRISGALGGRHKKTGGSQARYAGGSGPGTKAKLSLSGPCRDILVA
jgi:hypothetical protein